MSLAHVRSVSLALRQAVSEVVQDKGTNGLKATEKTSKFSAIEVSTSAQDTGKIREDYRITTCSDGKDFTMTSSCTSCGDDQAHQVPLTNPYPKGSAEVRCPVTFGSAGSAGSMHCARPCDWMQRDLRWSGALVSCRDEIWEGV